MKEKQINEIMELVIEKKLCVFPDWQTYDCTDDNTEINFANCADCWKKYQDELRIYETKNKTN